MKKYKFASFGRLAPEFKNLVDSQYHETLTCKVFDNAERLADEISDFNAFSGFSLPGNIGLDSLEWIHSFSAGVDDFFEQHTIPGHTLMTRTTGRMGTRIAEFCLAYILHDLKSIEYVRQLQQNKDWQSFPLTDLADQQVLIFGTGAIGSAIGGMLDPLCAWVDGVNWSGRSRKSGFSNLFSIDTLKEQRLDNYDVIINALPHTLATAGFFNQRLFSSFDKALFINIGRGTAVNTPDLIAAIEAKKIRKAILDVFEDEPLPQESVLWGHPNIMVTPHHSGKTNARDMEESFQAAFNAVKYNEPSPLLVDLRKGY